MRLFALMAIIAASACDAGSQTLFDSDFGDAKSLVEITPQGALGKISGKLPAGWNENSSNWCAAKAACLPMTDGERKFLRLDVQDLGGGRAQFQRTLDPFQESCALRLSISYRNPDALEATIGLRQVGHPFEFLKSTKLPGCADWTLSSSLFNVDKSVKDVGIWLNVDGVGAFDVESVKLERLNEAGLQAENRRKHPDGGPANLLRNPVLPLGLQSCWMIKRDLSDDEFSLEPDPSTAGPSACPSLKARSKDNSEIVFSTEPFAPVMLGEKHAFSVRYKGEGKLSIAVKDNQKTIGSSKELEGKDGWRIASAEFSPGVAPELCYARIEIKGGTVWIDAMEASPASKAGSFALPGACVVALGLPKSEASIAKTQFADEPAAVDCRIFGDSDGASLKASVCDLYGNSRELPAKPISAEASSLKSARIEFGEAIAERPFGAFRIEAFAERDGKRISPVNEIVVFRLRRPKHWGEDAPDSPFGVHMYSTSRAIAMAKAIGANWTRLHDCGLEYVGWWNLETEKGKWRFFDKEINRIRDGKVKIYGELGTAPKWASYYADAGLTSSGYWDKFFQPKNLSDYANYVKIVSSRYKGVIDDWDVWNEPWIARYWSAGYDRSKKGDDCYFTSKEPQKDYAALMKTACDVAKAENPKAYIVGFNTTTGNNQNDSLSHISGSNWTKGVLENRGMGSCDALCFHEYIDSASTPGNPENPMKRRFDATWAPVIAKFGSLPKPVWMTEGSPTHGEASLGFGLYKASIPMPNGEQFVETSDKLAKYILSLASCGVSKWFLYSMHSYGMNPNGKWASLVTPDGALHPSAAAHSALAFFIEGRKFARSMRIGDDAWALVFEGEDGVVAALSGKKAKEARSLQIPAGAQAFDLFGNPLRERIDFDGRVAYLSFKDKAAAEKAISELANAKP